MSNLDTIFEDLEVDTTQYNTLIAESINNEVLPNLTSIKEERDTNTIVELIYLPSNYPIIKSYYIMNIKQYTMNL